MNLRRQVATRAAHALAFVMRAAGQRTYRYFLDTLWEKQPGSEQTEIALEVNLLCPDEATPDADDMVAAERIFAAFKAAKQAQKTSDPRLLPSGGWRYVTDHAYAPLSQALADDDLEPFAFYLSNFRNWKEPTGIVDSYRIHEYANDADKRWHYEHRVIAPLVRWWSRTQGQGRPLSELSPPTFGNASGASVAGHALGVGAVFSEIHGRLVAGLAAGKRPVLAELGGGFGQLAYFIRQNLDEHCYLGFDLPETLCCASFFLLRAFPDRKFLLFGEGDLTDDTPRDYDFVLRPSFEMMNLPDRTVDLFVNENSLGAMPRQASALYIADMCRLSDQIWHRNHETFQNRFEDGETSLLNSEYPIPEDEFELLVRYTDVGPLIAWGRTNYDAEMVWYHYRRRA